MGPDELKSVAAGDMIQLGDHSWQVLDVHNGKALVLSESIIELRQYNRKFIDVTWETSTLRQYLNGDFYDRFNEEEKQYIAETRLHKNKNPWFNSKEGNATNDRVFLLTLSEAVKYFGDSGWLSNRPADAQRIDDQFNSSRIARDIDGAETWWWLRTPGFYGFNAAYVNIGGWIYVDGNNVNLYGGIRPAMWLKLQPGEADDLEEDIEEDQAEDTLEDIAEDTVEDTAEDTEKDKETVVKHDVNVYKSFTANRRKTDEHMHIMFDAAPLCCHLWDEEMNLIDCNQAAVKLFGFTDKQHYLKRFFELSPPIQPCGRPSLELMREHNIKVLENGKHHFEWMHRTPDGEPMPSEVTLIRVKTRNAYTVASYTRDLREFEATMAKIRETDALVQLMLDATPLCCNLWDDKFNTIECNQEAVKLFGLSDKQEYLERFSELSPPFQPCGRPSSETMLENIGKAFRDGFFRFGWMHRRLDDTPIPSEITLVRVKYKDGYIVAGYTRDLREHNKMINELELALKQATEASKAKSNFLSAMSHEMRTPMNAIIGMTSIGKKAEDIEDKNYALKKIGDTSAHLLGVINDVLDMAKIEADKLELLPVEFKFEKLLKKIMTVVSYKADEKKQVLIVNVDSKIPPYITGDDQRLAQVITNLIDNAVKFTPANGEISLYVSLIDETDDTYELCFEVSDSGIGISAQQQTKLFNAFEQAEGGMNREYGGTGLGLVISKNIVELMDGKIWVESDLGKGAKFIFTVKLQRSKKTHDLKDESVDKTDKHSDYKDITHDTYTGKKVLIAEDVEINCEILMAMLEDTGLIFECAVNGKEALDMVKAAPDKYDIIFMDLQMPLMDGYEATRQIRALPALKGKDLPIIALSANVFTSDIEACIAAGMNDHLGKPLDVDRIFDVLKKYLK